MASTSTSNCTHALVRLIRIWHAQFAPIGHSHVACDIVLAILENQAAGRGPLRFKSLHLGIGKSAQTTRANLQRLERAGWIETVGSDHDKRQRSYVLPPARLTALVRDVEKVAALLRQQWPAKDRGREDSASPAATVGSLSGRKSRHRQRPAANNGP